MPGDSRVGAWTIRDATLTDAAAIAALIRLAFATQSRPTSPPPSALRETAATVTEHLGTGGGAVAEDGDAIAEDGGALVGAVLWNEDEGALYVGRLSVHPAHRRKGIARALIDAAERAARRQGFSRLTLGTRLVLEDNRRLFASCGFVETGTHRHEGFTEPTWVSMERRLDDVH
jgi:GNAT superfamily N-acetyltransferase